MDDREYIKELEDRCLKFVEKITGLETETAKMLTLLTAADKAMTEATTTIKRLMAKLT